MLLETISQDSAKGRHHGQPSHQPRKLSHSLADLWWTRNAYTSPNCPWNTTRASPDSDGCQPDSSLRSRTVSTLPDRVCSAKRSPASPDSASKMADATAPVPQASVSPSTPRSYVRMSHPPPGCGDTKFTFAPCASDGSNRNGRPRPITSTAATSSTRTVRCGTPACEKLIQCWSLTSRNGSGFLMSVTG